MNTELFIANRLFFDKSNKQLLSKKIMRIALFGVALGLAVMIVSVAIITGFKTEIRNKVFGFGSHIQITNYDSGNSYESSPFNRNLPVLDHLETIQGIQKSQIFATKPGMIKTDESIQGIVFKGVDVDYDWTFFKDNLIDGQIPQFNDSLRANEILISENISKSLKIKTGESAILFFINENESTPRLLQLKVSGIYRTSLEEFDNLFVLGDLKQVQRLNDWSAEMIGGMELLVVDFEKINLIEQQVHYAIIDYSNPNSTILRTNTITSQYRAIFDWLSVLDMNVWVILILMTLVAGFNMISALLVLILERSQMIGVLKSLGTRSWNIRKIFLYLSAFLTLRGMLWGNIAGIAVIAIQKYFEVVKLNPATYYVDVAPVHFSLLHLLLLNAGTILITTLMMVIPSYLVSRISPEKVIRFD